MLLFVGSNVVVFGFIMCFLVGIVCIIGDGLILIVIYYWFDGSC